jgi:Fur family peroxide stress response transcriptional regulator
MEQNHQLICQVCGKVTGFRWDSFDAKELPSEVTTWGSIAKRQVIIRGICNECMKASRKNIFGKQS